MASDVFIIPASVFAIMIIALICLLCACYVYCRKTEAKRKIVYMMEEAQLDVDADDLVDDESDDEEDDEWDDELSLERTVKTGASAYS